MQLLLRFLFDSFINVYNTLWFPHWHTETQGAEVIHLSAQKDWSWSGSAPEAVSWPIGHVWYSLKNCNISLGNRSTSKGGTFSGELWWWWMTHSSWLKQKQVMTEKVEMGWDSTMVMVQYVQMCKGGGSLARGQSIMDIFTVSSSNELAMSMVTLASGSHGVYISPSSWKHLLSHLNFSLGESSRKSFCTSIQFSSLLHALYETTSCFMYSTIAITLSAPIKQISMFSYGFFSLPLWCLINVIVVLLTYIPRSIAFLALVWVVMNLREYAQSFRLECRGRYWGCSHRMETSSLSSL